MCNSIIKTYERHIHRSPSQAPRKIRHPEENRKFDTCTIVSKVWHLTRHRYEWCGEPVMTEHLTHLDQRALHNII